ncbi:B12-binding domain-containing radical SAM protein [bacterium]|nr:B12-binding domain-containing radical SAM protein [candidate division CSSED10-310 bacterium]
MTNHIPTVALISLQNTYIDFGIRYIASSCRKAGLNVHVLWITREPTDPFDRNSCDAIARWLEEKEVDLVGIGLMSVHVNRASLLTQTIQTKTRIPVIWGGVHAIVDPVSCLNIADYVCTGDGELSFVELASRLAAKNEPEGIDNIWFQRNGEILRTPRRQISDLDSFPPPDYELNTHWTLRDQSVFPLDEHILRNGIPWILKRHHTISSRGCPHACSYCYNTALKRFFGDEHYLRIRSVDKLMSEINGIIEQYPFIETISIMDDSFLFKPDGWLEEFSAKFKKTGRTFGLLVHPKTLTRDRIDMLIDAGLIGFQMGLQSGSERISRGIYNRSESVDDFIQTTRLLDEYMDRLHARTIDVIVDNPYETDEDQEETIKVLSGIKKPFHIQLFSLTLYPETDLYRRMVAEKKPIPAEMLPENKEYLKFKPTLMNRLIWMTHSTSRSTVLFFMRNRKTWWGKFLFEIYYHCWEKGLRIGLRKVKHILREFLKFARRPAMHSP